MNTPFTCKFRGSTSPTGQTWRGWKSVVVTVHHWEPCMYTVFTQPVVHTIHSFFTCHVSMHGCCYVLPLMVEFGNVMLSCFTLSCYSIFLKYHPCNQITRPNHRSRQTVHRTSWAEKLVNTYSFCSARVLCCSRQLPDCGCDAAPVCSPALPAQTPPSGSWENLGCCRPGLAFPVCM